jgi:hypothetical protein
MAVTSHTRLTILYFVVFDRNHALQMELMNQLEAEFVAFSRRHSPVRHSNTMLTTRSTLSLYSFGLFFWQSFVTDGADEPAGGRVCGVLASLRAAPGRLPQR